MSEEIGAIFIFDLESKEIEKQIPFGPPGDYEGLVLVRNTAYVACSDGRILEIVNFLQADTPKVIEYGTHLTVNEHVNGVCYDRKNRRLLVAIRDDVNENFKGIYSFNLVNKRMSVKPAIRVDLRHRVFESQQTKKLQTIFQPSDLDISPVTGQLYIIDGTRGQLLRMRLSESIRDLVQLDKNEVFQPEGITFTPSGEIYFASKGIREEPGMLLRVRIIN